MKRYVIIVAGGKGLRMGGSIPKQFLPVQGKPVLMRTMEAFATCGLPVNIVLVLPEEQQEYWRQLCKEYDFQIPYLQADGGATRFHSVLNGLRQIDCEEQDALVAVHDGVRPFVSSEVILNCFAVAAQSGAVVPVLDMVDSVRQITGEGGSVALDRSLLKAVQTPQTFSLKILRDAYRQEFSEFFTDDASVVESSGVPVTLVAGNRENIKITTPFDIKIAEAILND